MPASNEKPIDILLVSGFLGSGKTSLIRRLLMDPSLSDTALIINEFGEVGLDQFFVQAPVENTLLLENGCVCCGIRGDLIDTVADLLARVANGTLEPFSRIIIETTGLADPGPIVSELRRVSGLSRPLRLAKVITTVDAVLGPSQIDTVPEAVAQIVQSDLCLVTKAELVDPNGANVLSDRLRMMNPAARVAVLGPGPLDVHALLAPEVPLGASPRSYRLRTGRPVGGHRGVESWSRQIDEPLPWPRIRDWFDLLYSLRAANLVRMKALLYLEDRPDPVVLHGVGPLVSKPEHLAAWPTDRPQSRIVVITRNFAADLVEQSFRAVVTHPAGATLLLKQPASRTADSHV